MNRLTDPQLLRDYTERHSEAAFTELVRRHVDLVYSAALRMVCDAHLAEDVTQGAFVALAQNARQLTDHPVLSGWLHRTTQNLASKAVRSDVRRRAREQEAAAMNELLSAEPDAVWEHIAPHLDAALGELGEADRDALLLRYFERKSASEMAQTLGISDEAAQKRVSRAVERLREFFAKHGITVGASGLGVVITANAVQAAPVGLAVTISTAAALAGTITTATIAGHTAMNWLNLKSITAILAATIATGTGTHFVQQRETNRQRTENQNLITQQQKLTAERDSALVFAKGNQDELERLQKNQGDLLRLRGEVGLLRQENHKLEVRLKERTNHLTFDFPFLGREEWSEKGTSEPLATLQTMFWAMKQGDEKRLNQLVFKENPAWSLDYMLLPKGDWARLVGVQIVNLSDPGPMSVEGKRQQLVHIDTILEKKVIANESVIDRSIRRWSLVETNGQWLITGGR
ncbi:MAG: sigma-70 family RNA polymerase sigma factor [Verrucomicrobiota bacterium]